MAEPCWILTYPNGDDIAGDLIIPHFTTQAIAQERAATYRLPDLGTPTPRLLDQPCFTVSCACCGHGHLFDEDAAAIVHFTTLDEAADILADCCWTQQSDDTWRCEACSKGPCDLEADTHG